MMNDVLQQERQQEKQERQQEKAVFRGDDGFSRVWRTNAGKGCAEASSDGVYNKMLDGEYKFYPNAVIGRPFAKEDDPNIKVSRQERLNAGAVGIYVPKR